MTDDYDRFGAIMRATAERRANAAKTVKDGGDRSIQGSLSLRSRK
jgi:hypothetical protein